MTTTTANTSASPAPVNVGNGELDMKAELERLRKENEGLKKAAIAGKNSRKFALEVGDKGGVKISVAGSRFPITPYASDAVLILERAREIAEFMKTNANKLSYGRPEDAPSVKEELKRDVQARVDALLKVLPK